MNRKNLVAQIENILATEITLSSLARKIAKTLNTDIPHTPQVRAAGRMRSLGKRIAQGSRVAYAIVKGVKPDSVSERAMQVADYLAGRKMASSADIQRGLNVNRNVIAGAVHELKKSGYVRSVAERRAYESAGEYQGRERRSLAHDRPKRKRVAKRKA